MWSSIFLVHLGEKVIYQIQGVGILGEKVSLLFFSHFFPSYNCVCVCVRVCVCVCVKDTVK